MTKTPCIELTGSRATCGLRVRVRELSNSGCSGMVRLRIVLDLGKPPLELFQVVHNIGAQSKEVYFDDTPRTLNVHAVCAHLRLDSGEETQAEKYVLFC